MRLKYQTSFCPNFVCNSKSNMPLENGHTYYAVTIGNYGCPSLVRPIKVVITLEVKDLDLASLKYYPNPVD